MRPSTKQKTTPNKVQIGLLQTHIHVVAAQMATAKPHEEIVKADHEPVEPREGTVKPREDTVEPREDTVEPREDTVKTHEDTIRTHQVSVQSYEDIAKARQKSARVWVLSVDVRRKYHRLLADRGEVEQRRELAREAHQRAFHPPRTVHDLQAEITSNIHELTSVEDTISLESSVFFAMVCATIFTSCHRS